MSESIKEKLVSFLVQCKRIISIATKPTKKEFFDLAKIVAAGVAILGMVGFIIYLLFNLIIFR